jgi:Family of unknown function (DUF6609)
MTFAGANSQAALRAAHVHPYPMVRGGGAFLVCLGLGLILAAVVPASGPLNVKVFGIGAVVGLLAIPIIRLTAPLGRPTAYQVIALCGAIAFELILFWLVFSHVPAETTPPVRWIWAFLIVGVHFLPMGYAFGRPIVALGVFCIVNATVALLFSGLPFGMVVIVDGALKVGTGAYMLLTSVEVWHRKSAAARRL